MMMARMSHLGEKKNQALSRVINGSDGEDQGCRGFGNEMQRG
jgi:hypothetical protein